MSIAPNHFSVARVPGSRRRSVGIGGRLAKWIASPLLASAPFDGIEEIFLATLELGEIRKGVERRHPWNASEAAALERRLRGWRSHLMGARSASTTRYRTDEDACAPSGLVAARARRSS